MWNRSAMPTIAPPIFHAHADLDHWTAAAVAATVAALNQALSDKGRARLLVSGGSTPAPVYRALSMQPLDWSRVEIALVDERWLPAGDPDSNAHLITTTLLAARAAAARFEPLLVSGRDLSDSLHAANIAASPATVALLGMGPDGHTASLFPGAADLDHALSSTLDYVALDASGCPGAGPWRQRISVTPAGLARAALRVLLIRGDHKRALLQTALQGADPHELPIRAVLSLPGPPLHVHWCP